MGWTALTHGQKESQNKLAWKEELSVCVLMLHGVVTLRATGTTRPPGTRRRVKPETGGYERTR